MSKEITFSKIEEGRVTKIDGEPVSDGIFIRYGCCVFCMFRGLTLILRRKSRWMASESGRIQRPRSRLCGPVWANCELQGF